MMKEQLIEFETAKLAKEKGFNEICNVLYTKSNKFIEGNFINNEFEGYTAPTQSLLQKWLREEHNIEMFIVPMGQDKRNYSVIIPYCYIDKEDLPKMWGDTYEEALEKALLESLNLIKNN